MWSDLTKEQKRIVASQELTDSPFLCSCGTWLEFVSDRHGCPDLMRGTEIDQLEARKRCQNGR